MDAEHENSVKFLRALQAADDAAALALLDSGRVTIHSVVPCEYSFLETVPVIFLAVEFVREQVVLALVRLGADIDSLRSRCDGEVLSAVTPAGAEIIAGNVSGLSLCHRLGASMSVVGKVARGTSPISAVGAAITAFQPASLAHLLFSVYRMWPGMLSESEAAALSMSALSGVRAKPLFQVLKARGLYFNIFFEGWLDVPVEKPSDRMYISDFVLSIAQKSGDAVFLRYLMKDLGVTSSSARLDNVKNRVRLPPVPLPEVSLVKYKCATCESICATKVCTGCRGARYCSKECSRRNWKTGGHKNKCQELQRAATPAASFSAESSRP